MDISRYLKINSTRLLSLMCLFGISRALLPNGCSFEHSIASTEIDTIVCDRFKDLKFDIFLMNKTSPDYRTMTQVSNLYFHLNSPTLLDGTFRFDHLNFVFKNNNNLVIIIFKNIIGFDINQIRSNTDYSGYKNTNFYFVSSKLEFYSGRKLINNCEEYQKEHKFERLSFLQAAKNTRIKFLMSKYESPICTLAFNSAIIDVLYLHDLINTFLKSNSIRFIEPKRKVNMKSVIINVLLHVDKIDLDKRLFNPNIFKSIRLIHIVGSLNSIENELFLSFRDLEKIAIPISDFKRIAHKQGIDWMRNMNNGISIDLDKSNFTRYKSHQIRFKFITLHQYAGYDFYKMVYKSLKPIEVMFPDEDFCLYEKYPFNQLVILVIDNNDLIYDDRLTCTFIWLSQYNKLINDTFGDNISNVSSISLDDYYIFKDEKNNLINDCKFQERLSKCDKSKFFSRSSKQTNKLSFSEVMFLWDFISIILLPLICIFGTVTNILVIVNVSKKENKTILKENQYDYMKLKSIANCGIFFVQILSLMNICQSESGKYCPDIHRLVPIQYIKIIFVELFGNYFRFVSNLFYIAFLMNRLSLIGKDHSKFTKFMSETKVVHYSIFCLILGFIVTFVKVFRFKANFYQYNLDYPTNFSFDQVSSNHTLVIVFLVFNSICDILNGSVFLIFCLVIDICLAVSLKNTILTKEEKVKSMKLVNDDKKNNENIDAINRAVLLVVLNSLINFTCKLPSTLISINEMVQSIISLSHFSNYIWIGLSDKIYSVEMNCQNSNLCQALEKFSIDLFLLSLSLDFIFYYNFMNKN